MPSPIALCLENPELSPSDRYVACVALPGGEPGLAVARDGTPAFRSGEPAALDLWVSADARLMLVARGADDPVRVLRAGRSHDVPPGKPTVLVDQDEIELPAARLRVHIHGPTEQVAEPAKVPAPPPPKPRVPAVPTPMEIRAHPPAPVPVRPPPPPPLDIREAPPSPARTSPLPPPAARRSPILWIVLAVLFAAGALFGFLARGR